MIESMVDTHAHYVHKRFDSGREEILRELVDEGVIAVIEGAIDFASNQKMKLLCDKYSNVFMAAGCHPNCVEEMDEEKYQEIVELVKCDKVLAVGETGLDYTRDKSEEQICMQKEWFKKFIALAIETKKPLVIHCFSGSLEQARNLMNMGFYLGVNGMFTKIDEDAELCIALKSIPLEKVVLETDSPYLIPEGVGGKRNTSKNLNVIVEKYAELRGESPEHIREVVLKNTKRLYPAVFGG